MAIYNKPDENVFASSARQEEVSNFPDIGRGWGISFDQTGGIPPMEWFNFLFKRTDEKFGYLFQRGLSEWSATQTYPEGALVQYKNLTYKAKRANTNKNPEQANSLDWQRWGFTQSELKSATLTESGVTQLLTSVDSNDETKSATPKSVKMAYDKGVEAKTAADNANQNAEGRVSKSGDTMTGDFLLKQGDYSGLSVYNNNGYCTRLEGNPHNANSLLTLVYRTPQGANIAVVNLPKKNGTIAYADDVVLKSGGDMTGILYSVGISSKHYGYGAYANQYTSGAPFLVNAEGSQNRDTYHPFVKGLVRSKGRFGAGFSFGYTTKQGAGDGFGRGIIHLIEDNGANRLWSFEHNGDFNSAGDVRSSSGKSLNNSVQTSDYSSQWGQSGWVKLPNGFIIQWGKTPTVFDEQSAEVVFPVAFPNKLLNIQLTENQMKTVAAHATHLSAENRTLTKFTFKINSTLPISTSADWFAIGY